MWYRIYFQGNSVLVERSPEIDLILKQIAENSDELPQFVNLEGTWVRPSSVVAWHEEHTVNRRMRLAWHEEASEYRIEKPE